MKTEELIAILASEAGPVEPKAVQRRLYSALGWGLFAATLLMALAWGVRPDLDSAILLPLFWVKLTLPAAAALITFNIVGRLGRPGMRLAYWPWLLLALLAMLWAGGLASWVTANPAERRELIFGESWQACLGSIALLSLPLLIVSLWAMKGLAPTNPARAGAAAGLLAGTASAAIYALHCTEMAMPFLALWYVLGMLIPAAIGYAIGSRWLRW